MRWALKIAALFLLLPGLILPAAPPEGKKQILFVGASEGYAHDSVSHAMYTLAKLGHESGLFDVRFHTDLELLTKQKLSGNKKNLDYFDALFFYTQGDLPLSEQQRADLMSFVREDGKGFLAAHSGTDTCRGNWPEYVEMVGGAFNHHPWHQQVRIRVDDRTFPATKHFAPSFEITDEIYQLHRYSREKVRVLMTLDVSSVDLKAKNVERTDNDFAITWARQWGKGRVFASVLGHRAEVWDNPDIQKMWLEGIRWALGLTEGDTTSIPLPSED
jgi:type 1 glutamine amidotransferase